MRSKSDLFYFIFSWQSERKKSDFSNPTQDFSVCGTKLDTYLKIFKAATVWTVLSHVIWLLHLWGGDEQIDPSNKKKTNLNHAV